jgi:hypothetical protein
MPSTGKAWAGGKTNRFLGDLHNGLIVIWGRTTIEVTEGENV